MSINQEALEVLITIVKTGSFRAASEELHKAQSSISYAIKSLEQDLAIEIFDRNSYRPQLTEAGKLIYNKAKNILKMQDELKDFASHLKSGVEAKVSLVVSVVMPSDLLTKALHQFQSKFPQTQIELSLNSFDGPIKKLLAGKADLIVASDYKAKGDIEKISFRDLELIPVSHPDYPAADPSLQDSYFQSLTQIVVGDRSLLADEISTGLIESSNTWYLMDYTLKKEFIKEKLGWGFMPKAYVEDDLSNGSLVQIPTQNISFQHLYLMRIKSGIIGPAAQYLWELFKDNALVK